jgi:hydroxymethylpyrimidine pyrophosphatase-like HAD family hydrolase
LGNKTYIPIHVVPEVYKPIFTGKPVKPTPAVISTTVIKVNDKNYQPITEKGHKELVVDGNKFVPVKKVEPESVVGNKTIGTNGAKINTFKIKDLTYIPKVVVPKVYHAVFTHNVKKVKTPTNHTVVIKANNQHFVPDTTKKHVEIDEKVFVPVKVLPTSTKVNTPVKPSTPV